MFSFSSICVLASAQSDAPLPTPNAKVTVNLKVYALASGQKANVCSGVHTYQSKQYPFTFKNISLYENQVGASHLIASDDVYNLNNLTDFEGKFFSLQGGIEETTRFKIYSDKNAIINLIGWSNGSVAIQPGGSTIEFTK